MLRLVLLFVVITVRYDHFVVGKELTVFFNWEIVKYRIFLVEYRSMNIFFLQS